jgi:hypothetical protein
MKKKSGYKRLAMAITLLAALIVLQGTKPGAGCAEEQCLSEDLATDYGIVRVINFTDVLIEGQPRNLMILFNTTYNPSGKRDLVVYRLGTSGNERTTEYKVLAGEVISTCWYVDYIEGKEKKVYIWGDDLVVPAGGTVSVHLTSRK